MLHILLMMFKIILWILLGILGLVLLIVLLILFSPIRYRVRAKYKEKAYVKAKVSFLFVTVMIEFSQKTKELSKAVRVFGIKLGSKKKKSRKKKVTEDKKSKKAIIENEADLSWDNVNIDNAEEPLSQEEEQISEDSLLQEEQVLEEGFILEGEKESEKERIGDKIKKIAFKIKDIWQKLSPDYIMEKLDEKSDTIKKKYDELERKIKRYKKFWCMQCTVKTRRYLGKYMLSLARHIGPRKIKGYVHYGLKEPSKTGELTGYLSLLPFIYQKDFRLQPDFYEQVLEIDIDMKGRVVLGYILRIVTKPYLWRTLKLAKKINQDAKKTKIKYEAR